MQYVSQAEYEELKQKQAKGMLRYILIYGILGFGLPLGALLAIVNLGDKKVMAVIFVVMVLSGIPYAMLTWGSLQRTIKKYEEQNEEKL